MAPRKSATIVMPDDERDPVEDVLQGERINVADALASALDSLSQVEQRNVKGILYIIPTPNGKWEWIRDVLPPFDMSAIMSGLKEEFGGGEYVLKLMVDGRPRKNFHFAIMKEKTPLVTRDSNGADSMTMMMFQMMMKQSEDASRQRAEDMRDRQSAADRQMTMIVGLATAALPILTGGREKTSELMNAFAAMQPKPNGGGVLETLTIMKEAKSLFGGQDDKTGDIGEIVNGIGGMVGPGIKALGDVFRSRQQGPPMTAQEVPRADHYDDSAPPPLMLGQIPEGPVGTHGKPPSQYPVLDLIRNDVLYFFHRDHDPEKAADCVYDILEQNKVTEADINGLVIAISADPLGGLAAEGIDLRSRPEWGNEFLQCLVNIHVGQQDGSATNEQDDDSGRGNRRETDTATNGEASQEGRSGSVDKEPSRPTDD